MLNPCDTMKVFNLDRLTHNAVQRGKTGLSDPLKHVSITDTDDPDHYLTQVPEYFDVMDVRKKPAKYVEDKFEGVISEAFETRRRLEKTMSRRELLAFDNVLAKYLKRENVLQRLDDAIQADYSMIYQGRQMLEKAIQNKHSDEE